MFKIAEALVRFNVHLRRLKTPANPAAAPSTSKGEKGVAKNAAPESAESQQRQMEDLDRAAMDSINNPQPNGEFTIALDENDLARYVRSLRING